MTHCSLPSCWAREIGVEDRIDDEDEPGTRGSRAWLLVPMVNAISRVRALFKVTVDDDAAPGAEALGCSCCPCCTDDLDRDRRRHLYWATLDEQRSGDANTGHTDALLRVIGGACMPDVAAQVLSEDDRDLTGAAIVTVSPQGWSELRPSIENAHHGTRRAERLV